MTENDLFKLPDGMKTYTFNTGAQLQRLMLDLLFDALKKKGLRGAEPQVIMTEKEYEYLKSLANEKE